MATPAAVLSIIVEAQTGKAASELQRFNRGLSDKSIKITADIDAASFANAKRKAGTLGGKESVKLSADVDVSSFAKARAAQAVLTKESGKLTDVFDRSHLSIGQWTGILAAASPVVVDLAGALGALTASLGAATLGVGALGAGLAGVAAVGFGGIAAIAIPAIKSLGDVITAQQTLNKARSTGAGAAARAATGAAQQITAAENALANAQRSEKVAQDALNTARQEAVRQLQDMRRAAIESGTSEKRARLSLLQAEQNLRQLRKEGGASALDIRDAELSVVEARQNVKDVSIQAGRAQADFNKAQEGGISQMPQVISAQRSLADAQRSVAEANQGLADAQSKANAAAGAGATQQAALTLAMKKAGPAAVAFSHHLKDFTQRWRRLTAEGRNDFFGMLDDGLGRVNKKLPILAESANKSMKALRSGVKTFLDTATGPEFDHFVEVMTRTFAKSIGPVAKGLGNIAKVLQRIAVAVAPDIVKMARDFRDMTQGWVDSTKNAHNLREVVHDLVGQTRAWWDLLKAATQLILAVLIPGMGQGEKAVKKMTDQLKEWTNWANAHPKEIRDFMKEGLETTRKLADALLSFLPTLFEISKAARPIARFFLGAVKALNSFKIGDWSLLSVVIGAIVAKKVINGILAMRTAALGLKAALFGVAEAQAAVAATSAGPTVGGGGGLIMREGKVTTVAEAGKAGTTWGTRFATAARGAIIPVFGGLSLAIAGSIAAQPLLKKFHDIANRAADDFPGPFEGIGKKIADLGIPDELLPHIPEHPGGLLGLLGVGKDDVTDFNQTLAGLAKHILGGQRALRGMERVLGDLSTKMPQEAIVALRKRYGGLVAAGHQMSEKQRDVFVSMARVARENGDITQRQLERVTTAFGDNTARWQRMMRRAAEATGQSTKSIKRSVGDMTVRVSRAYKGMVEVTGEGLDLLTSNTNRALRGIAESKARINFRASTAVTGKGHVGHRAGPQKGGGPFTFKDGILVPGSGSGDKVPLQAMVEPGERLFVLNRNASKKLDELQTLNKAVPRFAQGGELQQGGFAGLQPGITGLMKKVIGQFGGSIFSGLRPWDTDSLHSKGLAADWIGGNWAGAARYANRIGSQLLEGIYTGAHGGPSVSWDTGKQVSPSFWGASTWAQHDTHIHFAVAKRIKGAIAKQLKRVMLKGQMPESLRSIGQGNLDIYWDRLNKYLAKQTPAIGAERGITKGMLGKTQLVSLWNATGKSGDANLMAAIALAESGGNPRAVNPIGGGDPTGLWQIRPTPVHPVTQRALFNAKTNAEWAHRILGSEGLGAWEVYTNGSYRQFLKRGGLVAPFVGQFEKGGPVAETGLGLLHKGEQVIPKLQGGGFIEAPEVRLGQLRRHRRALRERERNLEDRDISDKRRRRLENKLERLIESNQELTAQNKELRRDIHENNHLYKTVRANDRAALQVLSNIVGSQIGAQGLEKSRLAAAGSTRRY